MRTHPNKKASVFIFLTVLMGVSYFLYSAYVAEFGIDTDLNNQAEIYNQLQKIGVTDFQTKTINNTDFKFSSVKNKVVILNFWASWCGPCVEEFPSLLDLISQMKGRVALLALSLDQDEKQMGDFLKNFDVSNPHTYLLRDPDYYLAENFGTFKLPESYILGPDRKLIKKISGSINWTSPEIISLINSTLESSAE